MRGGVGLWRVGLVERTRKDRTVYPVTVRSVLVDGKPAPWVHQDNELFVRLYPAPAPGATFEVDVEHEGDLAIRPYGDAYWALGTWPWYPQPPLNGELASLDIHVKVPEKLRAFASGDTVTRETKDGMNLLHTHLDGPVQFPVVAAGDYHVFSDARDGVHCDVATYVFGKKKPARLLLDFFFAAIKIYDGYFHVPYPYKEMHIVEINQWGWGQAPPGVIFITQEAFSPLSNTVSQIFSQGINERIAHEIAHSWWGHVVKMDSSEEQWLTESFAEYSAALLLRSAAGSKRKGERMFTKVLNSWKGGTSLIGDGASIYLHRFLAADINDEAGALDRIRVLYNKGPLVLHAIRLRLRKKLGAKQGDRYFWALFRAFLKHDGGGFGSTEDLVAILNRITGDDWHPWFERYVYGCETPKIK
jgi:aminopeptidase N